jgi:hypothetical protein
MVSQLANSGQLTFVMKLVRFKGHKKANLNILNITSSVGISYCKPYHVELFLNWLGKVTIPTIDDRMYSFRYMTTVRELEEER